MRILITSILLFLLWSPFQVWGQHRVPMDSLKQMLEAPISDSLRAVTFQTLAVQYRAKKRLDSSVYFFDQILTLPPENLGPEGVGQDWHIQTYILKGMYLNMDGKQEAYLPTLREGHQQALAWGRDSMAAFTYTYLAQAALRANDFDSTLVLGQAAQQLAEQFNNPRMQGEIYGLMGSLYKSQKDYPRAATYIRKRLAIEETRNQGPQILLPLNNLSSVYQDAGDLDSAEFFLKRATRVAEENRVYSALPTLYGNLGLLFERKEMLDSARFFFDRARELGEKGARKLHLAYVYRSLGGLEKKLGNLRMAESWYLQALEVAREVKSLKEEQAAEGGLYRTYKAMGRNRDALLHLETAEQLEDSLTNLDRIKALDDLEAKYESEKKDRELAENALSLQNERNRRIWGIILASVIFLIMAATFLLTYYRQLARRKETTFALKLKEQETENLREMDQMKSRFFANISHEFRTPLTLILGPVKKLLDQQPKGELQHHLNLMHRNGKRLYELINQLLDLSRLEAGKLELSLQEGDIISFIKGVAHSFESLAASKEIHYQLTIPDQPQLVAFDPDKLQKILTNLLSNAFKYTPEEGQVDLQVTTDPESVKIAVSDSGMGIPEEQQAQIFDRFYRVEGSEVEGVGIGLALTKELVQLHEGHIDLESRIGKGTRIRVELPLRPAGTEALPRVSYQAEDIFSPAFTPVKTLKAQVPPEVNLQGEILIVEDNADVRELVGQALVKNFIIREAEDGEQGLLMARNYLPDLIVTDVMMPKLDGQAMTARLKEDELTCHIPIVMLTAKGDSPSKLAGLETGADDYLTKPFDEKELLTRVRNLIKQRKLLREKFSEADGLKLKEVSVNSTDQAFLDRVMGILEAKVADEQFSVEVFAQEVGLSRAQLHRRIKALTDMSPSILVRTVRLHRAKSLLMQGAGTAAEISYLVGFSSPAYFSKCFKDQFGLSPTEVRPGENKSSSPDSHL